MPKVSFRRRIDVAIGRISFEVARARDRAQHAAMTGDQEAKDLHEARGEAMQACLEIIREEEKRDDPTA